MESLIDNQAYIQVRLLVRYRRPIPKEHKHSFFYESYKFVGRNRVTGYNKFVGRNRVAGFICISYNKFKRMYIQLHMYMNEYCKCKWVLTNSYMDLCVGQC